MDELTSAVKNDLVAATPEKQSTRLSELSSILRFAGGLHRISGAVAVEVELDHLETAKKVRRELMELLGFATDAAVMQPTAQRSHPLYIVRVRKGGEILARQTGLIDTRQRPVRGLSNRLTTRPIEDVAAI